MSYLAILPAYLATLPAYLATLPAHLATLPAYLAAMKNHPQLDQAQAMLHLWLLLSSASLMRSIIYTYTYTCTYI